MAEEKFEYPLKVDWEVLNNRFYNVWCKFVDWYNADKSYRCIQLVDFIKLPTEFQVGTYRRFFLEQCGLKVDDKWNEAKGYRCEVHQEDLLHLTRYFGRKLIFAQAHSVYTCFELATERYE